jgi:hypothetical protein
MATSIVTETEPKEKEEKKQLEEQEKKFQAMKRVSSKLFQSPTRTIKEKEKKNYHLPPLPEDENSDKKIYSLVLDLDETLIHYEEVNS